MDKPCLEIMWTQVIVIPFVYDGLLAISYMIHDPFGEDMLDFPITAYHSKRTEERGANKCTRVIQYTRFRELGILP